MLWQKSFDKVVNQLRDRDIPLRIQLWNGTRVDLAGLPGGLRPRFCPALDLRLSDSGGQGRCIRVAVNP